MVQRALPVGGGADTNGETVKKIMIRGRLRRLATVSAGAAVLAASAATFAPSAQASTSASWIGPGEANNSHGVWCVQHLINDWVQKNGINGGGRPMTEDGIFGPQTEGYIKEFQTLHMGAVSDGIVGPYTGDSILEAGDQYYGGRHYCYTYLPTTW